MSDPDPKTDTRFSWSAHPAAQRPGQAALALTVILAIATVVCWSAASIAWGALALIVLLIALNRFFLPSRFTITEQGITAAYPLMRKNAQWRYIRRFALDDHGGYLSTRATPSRLDAYRGMHLLFDANPQNRDAAVRRIRAHIAAQTPQPQPHHQAAASTPREAAA